MTTAKRGRGKAVGLTRDVVIAAAQRVAEKYGFAGTQLRLVAVELDVSTSALYNHVSGKEELVDALADAFVQRMLVEPLPRKPVAQVRELVSRLYRAGLEHPGMLSNVVGHIPDRLPSAQMTFAERLLEALIDAGASEADARILYSVLVSLALGSSIAAANLQTAGTRPLEERLADCVADPELPLTGSYLASGAHLRTDVFEAQLDYVLRDLSSSRA